MQFSCDNCSTRYSVPDEKVRGKRFRTKCRKCGHDILVEGPTDGAAAAASSRPPAPAAAPVPAAAPTPAAAAPAPAAPAPRASRTSEAPRAEEKWTVAVERNDQRKMTTTEVVDAYAAGTINAGTLVWKHGMERWQPPFEVPVIALALGARGFTLPPAVATQSRLPAAAVATQSRPPAAAPVATQSRPPPAAPRTPEKAASSPSSSTDWDSEDEATRVVDGSLRFPGRPSRVPSDRPAPNPLPPAPVLPPPAMPKPAPHALPPAPVLPPPAMPKPPPRPPAAASVAPVAPPSAAPKPPAVVASRTKSIERPVAAPIEDLPSSDVASERSDEVDKLLENTYRADAKALVSAAFDFEGEATAIIAPDRAKELLDAEAAKSAAPEAEAEAPEAGSETPISFGFDDDESTKVIAPEKANELLSAPGGAEKPAPPLAFPEPGAPAAPAPEAGRAKGILERVSARPPPPAAAPASAGEDVGSVVVDQPGAETRPKPPTTPAAPKPAAPGPSPTKPPLSLPSAQPLPGMANEPTRVVRVKKKADTTFWVVLFFALAAAAAGGFVASEMLRHGQAPSWLERR